MLLTTLARADFSGNTRRFDTPRVFLCTIGATGTPLAFSTGQSQHATARPPALAGSGFTLFEEGQRSSEIMLVLSRKVGERIHVGDNIVLEIRRIAGNRVTVALEAPRDVRILRGELEGPAREFRSPDPKCDQPAQPLVTPAHLSVLQNLSAGPVDRHCVT
jgi:carbon storage regulator